MNCRVWGVVNDRLIELLAERDSAFRIVGLPQDRSRTTADRVRAALLNAKVVREAPSVAVRLDPPVLAGHTIDLDLPVALAVLGWAGLVGTDLRWILATGRLALDGSVVPWGGGERIALADVLERLCHTPVVGSEHMFGERGK